jgi:hypothetical protein
MVAGRSEMTEIICPEHHIAVSAVGEVRYTCLEKGCISERFCPSCGYHVHKYRGNIILEVK